MARLHQNQSYFRLQLDTNVDVTTATTSLIKYIKPDKTAGQFTATATETTKLYYDFTNADGVSEFNQLNNWVVWAHVTFSDGRIGIGRAVKITVFAEGIV